MIHMLFGQVGVISTTTDSDRQTVAVHTASENGGVSNLLHVCRERQSVCIDDDTTKRAYWSEDEPDQKCACVCL